jgi:autotransporter-associated beta strand protein
VATGATLQVDGASLGDTTAAVTLNGTGNLTLSADETIGSLAGAGTVTNGGNTLTAGGDDSSTAFSGVASGAGGLTKSGSGTLTLSGANTYAGATTVNAGTLTLSGGSIVGEISNQSLGTFIFSGGNISNNVRNSGTFKVEGQRNIDGNYTSTGSTLDLTSDAVTGTTLTIGGDLALTGEVKLDANLENGTADSIAVGETLSGTAAINFNELGTVEKGFENITVISFKNKDDGFSYTMSGLPENGNLFNYQLIDTPTEIQLQSTVGSGIASLAATVGLTQTIVGAIVNRPTSPFVGSLVSGADENPCGEGGWVHLTGGNADADGTYKDTTSGQSGTAPVSLLYKGVQVGTDKACFDGTYNGWDMAFGGIAGANFGTTENKVFGIDLQGSTTTELRSVTNTNFDQAYGGAYLTASKGRYFSDVQYRFDNTKYSSTNKAVVTGAGVDLTDSVYNTYGSTISGSFGYSMPIGEPEGGLTFVSSAGASLSDLSTTLVNMGEDGSLKIGDTESRIGFISGTVAKSKVLPDGESLISYFGTFTSYEDFGDDPTALYSPAEGDSRPLVLSNVGKYNEISAGLNFVRILSPSFFETARNTAAKRNTLAPKLINIVSKARQLNANIRLDSRFANGLNSMGVAAQVRLQF